jgi:hypothetical protein
MTLSLAGDWRYSLEDDPDHARPDFKDRGWATMRIPQNWFLAGLDHHGTVWFRHSFNQRSPAKLASLHFNGVDYSADVYLNGRHLGSHTGCFDPFEFEAGQALRPGRNLLAVRVESPYEIPGPDGWHRRKRLLKGVLNHHDCRPGGGWEPAGQSYNTGGIWNRVYLEEHGPLTVDRLGLRADLEVKDGRFAARPVLHVELSVRNRTRKQAAVIEVQCAPENFKAKAQTTKVTVDLPAGASLHSLEMPMQDARLWQPWDRGFPHLYKVTARLTAGRSSASRASVFGFRSLRIDEGYRWFVNGQPYFPRGSNYIASQWLSETLFPEVGRSKQHPFHPTPGIAADWFGRDVELARRANLNLLRVHAHILPPEFHEACDRAGILVWQDFPLIWGYADEPGVHIEAERLMRVMIDLLGNHPSIAAWCCHNESPWDAPWMAGADGSHDPSQNRELDARLQQLARQLDPTRYVHMNSGRGDGHVYPGWYFGHTRDFQNLPGAPFVTEYGAQALPARESLLRTLPQFGEAGYPELVRFKAWLEATKKIKPSTRLLIKWGTALWNFTERTPGFQRLHEMFRTWAMKQGMRTERSVFQVPPAEQNTPSELRRARQVWMAWRFHNFQPPQTFENGIRIGSTLDEFIASSQDYQAHLIQYATENYRRAKACQQNEGREVKATGLIHFDFTDPWPAITWSVLDYWRVPKPAFDVLRRSMQPVLPSFLLPEKIEAGRAALASFRAVNDLLETFPKATCEWRLSDGEDDLASATFPVSIPADGVSDETHLTLLSLGPGSYRLYVNLTAGSRLLGENWYDIKVDKPEVT